jgi:hypothetical protein
MIENKKKELFSGIKKKLTWVKKNPNKQAKRSGNEGH